MSFEIRAPRPRRVRLLDCGTCEKYVHTCSPENPHGHLAGCPMWGQDACTERADCRCVFCLPDVDSTPALNTCPQCSGLKPVNSEVCTPCNAHNVRYTNKVERAMKVAAFGEGRC